MLPTSSIYSTSYSNMVEGGGFEPPKLSRQIYSLIPLATREPLRKAAYCPDGLTPCQPFLSIKLSTYAHFISPRTSRLAGTPSHREIDQNMTTQGAKKRENRDGMELARGIEPPTG